MSTTRPDRSCFGTTSRDSRPPFRRKTFCRPNIGSTSGKKSAVHSAAWDQAAGRGARDGGESWQARSHRDQSTSAGLPDRLVATGHRWLLGSSRVTPASSAHGLRMSSSCEVPHRMARPASRSTVSLRPMACIWLGRGARYLGAGSTRRVRAGTLCGGAHGLKHGIGIWVRFDCD